MSGSSVDSFHVDIHRIWLPEDSFLNAGQIFFQLISGVFGLCVELGELAGEEVFPRLLRKLLVQAAVLLYLLVAKALVTSSFDYSTLHVGEGLSLIHLREAVQREAEQPVAFLVLGELPAKLALLALSVDHLVENFRFISRWRHLYSLLWACDVPALADTTLLHWPISGQQKEGSRVGFPSSESGCSRKYTGLESRHLLPQGAPHKAPYRCSVARLPP